MSGLLSKLALAWFDHLDMSYSHAVEDDKGGTVPPDSTFYLSKRTGMWHARRSYGPQLTLFPDGKGEVDREAQRAFMAKMGPPKGPGVALVNIVDHTSDP